MEAKVRVVTTQGVLPVELPDSDDRSAAASHLGAIRHYRDTGDPGALASFRGVRVGGHELETDPVELEGLADEGELDFDTFYEEP